LRPNTWKGEQISNFFRTLEKTTNTTCSFRRSIRQIWSAFSSI